LRRIRRVHRLKLLLLAVVLCWPALVEGQELGPPLPSWFPLTSTFCEYRTQHFHAGIDLATGGRIGVPVLAVSRGHVHRVRVSGAGYGKAVYLLLDNGMTAVYGHLDRFSDEIESFVLSRQLESGEYEQDLFPPPNEISVEQGETIGFSGDTGASSGPHLHFELKRGETALNPLRTAYCLADDVRPVFNYVRLVPAGHESEIDGVDAPCVVRLKGTGRHGTWDAARIPRVTGSFYVSVSVFDRTGGASNRLAVYEAKLFLDDSLIFESRFDGIEDLRTHEVELAYDLGLARRGERFTLNLRRFEGSRLRALQGLGPQAGVIDVEQAGLSGQHTLRVEARDVVGNCSTVVLRFLAAERPSIESVSFRKNGPVLSVEARVEGAEQTEGAGNDPDQVWLRYTLGSVSGKPAKVLFQKVSPNRGSSGATVDATHVGEVRLPAALAEVALEDLAGVFKVWAENEHGFVSAPYTVGLTGTKYAGDVSAELYVTRRKDFAEIRVNVTPHFLRPRIGVVVRDTVWLKVVEERDGQYRARFRFSHLFSDGGTAVCLVEAGNSRVLSRSRPIALRLARKGADGIVESAGGDAVFKYESETFYGDTYVSIARREPESLPAGLSFVSDVFSIEPGDVVFDKRGAVVIRCPDGAVASGKVAVYGRESGSRWNYVGAVPDTLAKTLGAQVRTLCDFALIRDEVPPNVSGVRPRSGRVTTGGTPPIHAFVRDVGSGVEWKGMTVTMDGRKVLSVWEPRYFRLSVVHSSPLAPGRHRVVFEVKDRAGNLRVAETSFRVSR